MDHRELQKRLTDLSDTLMEIPLVTEIRYDTVKCTQTDEAITQVLAEIDYLIDEVKKWTK